MKAYLDNYIVTNAGSCYAAVSFVDETSGNSFVENTVLTVDTSTATSAETVFALAATAMQTYATGKGWGALTYSFGMFATTNGPIAPASSALSLSLQTSTGAVGTQVSTTKNSWVTVAGSISTSATIGGASAGDILLEVAPTNSAAAGDWVEWGRIGNSQTITLAVALQSIQVIKGQLIAFVPAGYYVKARTLTGSGSPTYALLEAKQVII